MATNTMFQRESHTQKVSSQKHAELASAARTAFQDGRYPKKIEFFQIITMRGGGPGSSKVFVIRDIVYRKTHL